MFFIFDITFKLSFGLYINYCHKKNEKVSRLEVNLD